jgi:VWFA-related protein
MKKRTGRKALIVLTDGVDNSSKESLGSAIEAAQRSDTMVYSILFYDAQAYSRGGFGMGGIGRRGGGSQETHPDGKGVLERLSQQTGGRMFEVSKKQTVAQIYASIQEELRNQYSLGYSPDRGVNAPRYRKIHVTTKQKDLAVQARDGYYADK